MADLSQQLREGMEVYTADGTKLGKISQVWFGTSVGGSMATEEETCFELHRGLLVLQLHLWYHTPPYGYEPRRT